MGTAGRVKLSAIKKMFKRCAPGTSFEPKKHRVWVHCNGKTYSGLPKGAHGKGDPEIERGHVKQMVRFFELDPTCVGKYLPELGPLPEGT